MGKFYINFELRKFLEFFYRPSFGKFFHTIITSFIFENRLRLLLILSRNRQSESDFMPAHASPSLYKLDVLYMPTPSEKFFFALATIKKEILKIVDFQNLLLAII